MKRYKIVVEWYKNKKAIEEGRPFRVSKSGFSEELSLVEANILKSKMSDAPCCGMLRLNKIVEC